MGDQRHLHFVVHMLPLHVLGFVKFFLFILGAAAVGLLGEMAEQRLKAAHGEEHLHLVHAIAHLGINGDVVKRFLHAGGGDVGRIAFVAEQCGTQGFFKIPEFGPFAQEDLGDLIDEGGFHFADGAFGINGEAFAAKHAVGNGEAEGLGDVERADGFERMEFEKNHMAVGPDFFGEPGEVRNLQRNLLEHQFTPQKQG